MAFGAKLISKLHTVGFADLTVSGRYALLDASFVVSLQGGVKLPLWYEAQPDNDGAPLGTGDVDFEAHLLVGKSLFPLSAYLTSSIGYRCRTGELHDQVVFSAELGYSANRFLTKVTLDGVRSTITPPDLAGQPVTTPLPGGGGAVPNVIEGDQNIFKVSPSVTYKLNPSIALQGELFHTFAGKNTVAGTTYSFVIVLTK